MQVSVKFMGVPAAAKAVGQKEFTAQIDEPTLGGLLRSMEAAHGGPIRKALCNQRGDVDDAIQILHTGAEFIPRDALTHPLSDGDQVTFMMMMAGG